jgi:hypothetical protein
MARTARVVVPACRIMSPSVAIAASGWSIGRCRRHRGPALWIARFWSACRDRVLVRLFRRFRTQEPLWIESDELQRRLAAGECGVSQLLSRFSPQDRVLAAKESPPSMGEAGWGC